MPKIARFQPRAFLRRYTFRLAFWAACTTAVGYGMKSSRLWVGDKTFDEAPVNQELTAKFDEMHTDWWTSTASLEALISDYYGEDPNARIVTIEGFNSERATFQPSASIKPFSSGLGGRISGEMDGSPLSSEASLATFYAHDWHDHHTYYYVQGSISGTIPESGVDLSAQPFRLGLVAVPEPASGVILACGVASLAFVRRRAGSPA